MKSGAVLPIVLFAIAMGSALAVGGAYVTRQMASAERVLEWGAGLEPVAERAVVEAIAAWDSLARAEQPVGAATALGATAPSGVQAAAWITRFNERTYWIVGEAYTTHKPMLRRRLGALVVVAGGYPSLIPQRAWGELP